MINNKSVLALIPARGGSKGLPGKNLKLLSGTPLIGWPIKAAKNSKYIDRVIVSTDDPLIAETAKSEGADIPFLRPKEFATDRASTASVINHALDLLEGQGKRYSYLVLLEPTSPLTSSSDIDRALDELVLNRSIADSIVGTSKIESQHPSFSVSINNHGLIEPYNYSETNLRRQDISDLYYFEGSLYITDIQVFKEKSSFYHERTLPYIVPKWKAFEVDDIIDFICIEAIMRELELIEKYTCTSNVKE